MWPEEVLRDCSSASSSYPLWLAEKRQLTNGVWLIYIHDKKVRWTWYTCMSKLHTQWYLQMIRGVVVAFDVDDDQVMIHSLVCHFLQLFEIFPKYRYIPGRRCTWPCLETWIFFPNFNYFQILINATISPYIHHGCLFLSFQTCLYI